MTETTSPEFAPAPPPVVAPSHDVVLLRDPWRPAHPILLDGILERSGWPPLLMFFILLGGAFLLFQVLIAPLAATAFLLLAGVPVTDLVSVLTQPELQAAHMVSMMKANTVAQFLGLAVPTLLLARLHAAQVWAFLRVRRADPILTVLAVLGTLGLFPLVQVLGTWGELIPWPEWVNQMEQVQMDLLEGYLAKDPSLWFSLFAIAVTPALCEEVLFRGYLQRQMERAGGVFWSIVLVGILFGFYHIRFPQAFALSLVGIYLGYVTWRTGSIIPAVLVHFVYNGSQVLLASSVAASPEMSMEAMENWVMPWYWVALGMALVSGVVWLMNRLARQHLAQRAAPHALPTQKPLLP